MTCSGVPLKRLRSTGSCVATPTGQVLRWHLRIMMQPAAISGAVEKPNSSAPSSAPMMTSRPVLQAAIDLQRHARAQAVQHQRLVRLGKAHFPWAAGMLERGQRRSAGAAVIAGDGDVVGARLGDAGRNRADADFRDQLDRHVGRRIDVLQIVDQLRQILDRIDVVMRRRRDQADARRRMAGLGDGRVDLVAGQLAALAGLGALRHLDLHHVGIDEIFGRHAEAARRDLLDRRAFGVRAAAGQRQIAVGLLAALAGVRLAADRVHGARQRRVRLARDRAERHRAGREPLDDVGRRHRPRRAATGLRPVSSASLILNRPRMVCARAVSLSICAEYSLNVSHEPLRTACCKVATASGDQICASPRMR